MTRRLRVTAVALGAVAWAAAVMTERTRKKLVKGAQRTPPRAALVDFERQ